MESYLLLSVPLCTESPEVAGSVTAPMYHDFTAPLVSSAKSKKNIVFASAAVIVFTPSVMVHPVSNDPMSVTPDGESPLARTTLFSYVELAYSVSAASELVNSRVTVMAPAGTGHVVDTQLIVAPVYV